MPAMPATCAPVCVRFCQHAEVIAFLSTSTWHASGAEKKRYKQLIGHSMHLSNLHPPPHILIMIVESRAKFLMVDLTV